MQQFLFEYFCQVRVDNVVLGLCCSWVYTPQVQRGANDEYIEGNNVKAVFSGQEYEAWPYHQ